MPFEPQILRNLLGLFSKACLKIPQLLLTSLKVIFNNIESTNFSARPTHRILKGMNDG